MPSAAITFLPPACQSLREHRRSTFSRTFVRSGLVRPAKATAETRIPEEEAAASSVCATCGISLDAVPNGCDQKGRVVGGIGAIADWWPIKAYRPCPALTQAGMNYNRKGQILDDMLFGRRKERKS